MKAELGLRGQNEFSGWCEPEQFHVQRADPDRLGWDFMLEADPDRSSDIPLDQQNELPKFLVQVKATEHANAVPHIKLSALKHLVDADLPAVIAILFYSKGGRRSVRRLIVPIDEAVIEDTLRRVREQEAHGNRAIHTIRVLIPTERAVEIGGDGEGLSDALHAMLHGSLSNYVARKSQFRETCGFDDEPMVGRFFIPGPDARHRLGELFLGGRRELDVNHLTLERRRFGIPLGNDQLYFRDAVLEMDAQPLLSASIELESEAGDWIALPVDVFVVPPLVDARERSPIRLANRFFEVVLDFDKGWAGITVDYAGDREVDLEEAVSIVQVGAILARPKKNLTIHFKGAQLALLATDKQGPFNHWIPVAPTLRRLCAAISRSARRPHTSLRLSTFYDWVEEHQEKLALGSTAGVNLFFRRWAEDSIVDEQDTILTPMSVELVGLQYTALVEIPIVSVSRQEMEIKIVGGQPHVVDDVIRAPGADISDFIDLAVESSKRRRNITGPALVAGGIEPASPAQQ
ncbi:hypothetical protein [Prosthecodimorpha staleyi]|uniref:DUF4365 domain-containing protein n=1 Tax=Prosthecodimorpha staleyi TaxID=2840188 RepID=A0A947D6P8_9HYPH|nr:hypothetical protein [Prosthecodimorpha staleyi]MBT9291129.1 hypothetical protein [Prosthecodimorpha staleyi]